MSELIVIVILVVLSAVLLTGGYAYHMRIGKPRGRRKALEASLDALAEHNVRISFHGSSQHITQAKRTANGITKPLSVLDVLNRSSTLNKGGDWRKLTFHEGFHQGPYDDELTDEEWQFVHRRYTELVEQKTSRGVSVEIRQKYLRENEERIAGLSATYVDEARRIAEGRDDETARWDADFSSLDDDDRD